ncbi:hypothetical protein FBY35_5965 [Streptomyces sp. SLBN-118]|uniref:hypothetical protein n=1 Tax=Streptomyces sp. SLBN-118 TaxID=2768454 RepID=UPI0011530F4E|nr:hypothetical protein [Streptomyces sp. SLBN-118]TQK44461.1 hypothetical protein FBY35_5965 [Streptomyces sp. SLBN-118]
MARTTFPDDLVQAQRDWIRTYEELACRSPVASTTALRRRLIQLPCGLASHPFWTEAGQSSAALAELRHHARARGWTQHERGH